MKSSNRLLYSVKEPLLIIQLLRYVIHAMRKLFEVRTMAAILIFTTHAIDACGISYQTGFNCIVHAFFGNLCVDGAVYQIKR